ncbi:NACHT, LRR and PYD domains-containing protein 3-like [Mantella aurantiaca]
MKFHHRLSSYNKAELPLIYNYFRDDLEFLLETSDTRNLLSSLKSRNILNTEVLLSVKREHGAGFFAKRLLQDISDQERNAIVGFWECFYELDSDYPNSVFLAILDELYQRGDRLVDRILLDRRGPALPPELTDIRIKHKQHLLEETQSLVVPRLLGSTLEAQRFPIKERYVKLTMISAGQVKELSQNDLIQTGKRHVEFLKDTQIRLEPVSTNKLFSWNRQSQCVPHVVMVNGLPGIGKTTLMQKLVYDWANGEIYQRFAFVFFFKFRELHDLQEISLEKLILGQYPHLESHIGDILQCPEELLFIFDGLDERIHQIDFGSRKLCTDPKKKDSFHVIVVSLVTQRLLMGCSILVTSRATKQPSYNTDVFQRMTEIIGFVHRHRLIYFEHFFGDEALSEKAFQYLQENATLYTLCYMPSYCWIVCTVLSMCFRAHPTNADQLMASSPKTMTQLFVTFVSNILANHSHEKGDGFIVRDLLSSFGRMAEYGVMNHIVMFDDHHLDAFRVKHDNPLFSCFLMKSGQPPHVNYTFLHLTLQDFFAALLHFINYNPNRLQESFDGAELHKDGHYEILHCFLCGLTDASTRSMLESHVGKLSDEASRQIISWLQKKTTKDPLFGESFKGTRELLHVFYYLHEARNKELVLQCIGSNRDLDLSYITLTSADCSVLSFILESCRMTEHLSLMMCNIENDALRKLVPTLHTIRNLSFIYSLTDSCSPHLASGIRDNQTLRKLDLSKNNLKGPHFSDLMAALSTSRIEELL